MQYAVAFRYFAFYLMHLLLEIYLFDRFFLVHRPDVFIISLSGQRVRDKECIFMILLGEILFSLYKIYNVATHESCH